MLKRQIKYNDLSISTCIKKKKSSLDIFLMARQYDFNPATYSQNTISSFE